jgi:iron complex outermembrane recepter protein
MDGKLVALGVAVALILSSQPRDARSAELQEIVVTAQKREQSLQEVSAPVTAIGADRLQNAHIDNLEDLQLIAPSITFGTDFNIAKVFIRGVGENTSTTGSEPGVALHVDGAVVARPEAQLTSLFDLERVEVLRGPQGTLYGRNATGGSINLITRKPTAQLDGYARVTFGNFDALAVEAALGGPVSDVIRVRLAVKDEQHEGFGENPVTGNDVDDLNRRMARAEVMVLPADSVDWLLSGEWFRQDDASGALHFWRESFLGIPALAATGIGGYAVNPRDLASEDDPHTSTDTWAVTSTLNWHVSDAFTVTNISNYRDFKTSVTQDLDVSAVVNSLAADGQASTIQRRDVVSRQKSSEFQLKYAADRLNGVFGLYYFNEDQTPTDTVDVAPVFGAASNLALLASGPIIIDGARTPAPFDPQTALALCNTYAHATPITSSTPIPPKRVCAHSIFGTDAYAAFGQTTIELGRFSNALETLSLKLGGRYSWERRTSANPSIIFAANGRGPVLVTTAGATYRARNFSDFTPEAGLEWRPVQRLLLYYTYSEGFKSGAGENAAGSTTIVGPEKIRNHEVGLKSEWLDRRLAVNLAAFSYRLNGLQISKTINDPVAGFVTRFENAASVSGKGVELEVLGAPMDRLRVTASLDYLHARFDDFTTADPLDPRNIAGQPLYNPQIIQLAGNPTRNSPDWSGDLHGEWDLLGLKLPASGYLTLSGDLSYKSEIFFTEFDRLLEGSRAYAMLDASLRYTSGDDKITLELWGKNLTDTLRPSSTFALATARTIGVSYLPPRTYGVTAGYRF